MEEADQRGETEPEEEVAFHRGGAEKGKPIFTAEDAKDAEEVGPLIPGRPGPSERGWNGSEIGD